MEEFALSLDREKVLGTLIPGTEDYYYYHCLHLQNQGSLQGVEEHLGVWKSKFGETGRWSEISHRQKLLSFDEDPKGTLSFLKIELGPDLTHQREVESRQTDHPVKLDPALISRKVFLKHALKLGTEVDLFRDEALEWLNPEDLSDQRRMSLLARVARPDFPNLVKLILAQFKHHIGKKFGSFKIHHKLLPGQLEELQKAVPALLTEEAFVEARISKLHPSPDSDWRHDPEDRELYLERLWAFVSTLAPAFNSLKAHVLHHRLAHDRALGLYDRDRFLAYLKLPRTASYMDPEYLGRKEHKDHLADLRRDFNRVTLLAVVGNDEELVRDYLEHFLAGARDTKPFVNYVRETWVTRIFAEVKILTGARDPEKWTSLIDDPAAVKAIKDRVELAFPPSNPAFFRAADDVNLDLDVKNVRDLTVKVFEINTLNYFLAGKGEVDTSIDLDGLVPAEQQRHEFDDPPFRRVRRTFRFPSLKRPGVFVVEFIGGGKSSRALVRKGGLQALERVGAAGHSFTLLDEEGRPAPEATLWLSGHEYRPGRDGTIMIPFSNSPGFQKILLKRGELTSLASFQHLDEEYTLTAGFCVDRESLLKRCKASVLVRPSLTLHGRPVSLSLLENVRLTIETVDHRQVVSKAEIPNFPLAADREALHQFSVPEDLAAVTFTLSAEAQVLSRVEKPTLSASRTIRLNEIDATDAVDAMHLARSREGYSFFLLGKTGEARADQPVVFEASHRGFKFQLKLTLQTDSEGRVALGPLDEIDWIKATSPSSARRTWVLPSDRCFQPSVLHGREGETLLVPVMAADLGAKKEPPASRSLFSLLETRGDTYVSDRFEALEVEGGYLKIKGLPAGDYDLLLKDSGVRLSLRIAAGERVGGWIAGGRRRLEAPAGDPLQIASASSKGDSVRLSIAGGGKDARLHVVATRFLPGFELHGELSPRNLAGPGRGEAEKALSDYVAGREIGDEYRYILERRQAQKFPGNMLARPGLLLNPWAVRKTETGVQEARGGEGYSGAPRPAPAPCMQAPCEPEPLAEDLGAFANLDFLSQPSVVLANLSPDKDGAVTLDRKLFPGASELHLLALDRKHAVYRRLPLEDCSAPHRDLRLRLGLDPERHFTEKKQVTLLEKGQTLEIADIATSQFEACDTLSKVHALFSALSGEEKLQEFRFLLDWPGLPAAEKNRLLSEYACHELHFFLSRKDPAYFETVVRPHLLHKRDKTFLDRYLVGADLSAFLEPWPFGRLNAVERILLSKRLEGQAPAGRRHAEDLFDLLPRDLEREERLFSTAIKGSALKAEDSLGFAEASAKAFAAASLSEAMLPALEAPSGSAGFGRARSSSPAARLKRASKRDAEERREKDMECLFDSGAEVCDEAMDLEEESCDFDKRAEMRQFYQKPEKTSEWAENNYHKLAVEEQGPELVTMNAFWRDFARHDGAGPFLSEKFAEASRTFTEMIFALSVLDLPFEAGPHGVAYEEQRLRFSAATPAVVFHKEIKPAAAAGQKTPVLVSQNYFRADDRYAYEGGETLDKYVTEEFLVFTVYLCQVVLTNPTSSSQNLELLLQIPRGALPVRNGFFTRGLQIKLGSYGTHSLEYAFYFPAPGEYPHYPVHAAKNEEMIAAAGATTLKVVRELSRIDRTSWAWISQNGTAAEVVDFLEKNNLDRLKLEAMAWRMADRKFYAAVLPLLSSRRVYCHQLWAYSLKHGDKEGLREYLRHEEDFLRGCGPWLESPLVKLDPAERGWYEHLEYAPFINARAHALGGRHKILNDRFSAQYSRCLDLFCHKPRLSDDDWLAAAYYLLLQDRIEEGLEAFGRVREEKIDARIQYDYLKAFAAFFSGRPEEARETAKAWADYPVDRWRNLFQAVLAQLDEAGGAPPAAADDKDRAGRQAGLASSEPGFDFSVENLTVTVDFQNLKECRVNYYLMDIELLFSRQPFVQQQSEQFGFIRPNRSDRVELPASSGRHSFELPEEFRRANVVVELEGGTARKSQAYFAHDLAVQVIDRYGHLQVTRKGTGAPLPLTYVKVYARKKGGKAEFYKDGYTDLRGRFDYVSLNTDEMDSVDRFALLILHEEHGSVIKEAAPPKR